MIQAKIELEGLIPAKYTNTFRAIQIRNDRTEAITSNLTNPKKLAKFML